MPLIKYETTLTITLFDDQTLANYFGRSTGKLRDYNLACFTLTP